MIQHTEKAKCETNMTGGTAFTIQANAKMFKILSSGLYSNKERAIIREVSCNASDANVDAGNGDVPIVVHLPNTLEPFFSIKDSGPGLNPDQMVNIYTQYGNSTKTDRNDQIGALGLGSKSPFSYIDSFTVISITEGVKNTYSCYIDGNGEPQLQPFGTEDSDEVNGVEVTFPVKTEDFDTFRKEAEIVYRPFEVKPDVVGNSSYSVKSFEVLLTSDDTDKPEWQVVQPERGYYGGRDNIRVAVQGNIEYPISTHQIEGGLSKVAQQLIRENYRLRFDIGDLDIAASREELGYDKVTVANIVAKFEKMAGEIEQVQQETIDTFETKYEAMSYISTLKESSRVYTYSEFEYNGEKISNSVSVPTGYDVIKYVRNGRGTISRTNLAKDAWKEEYNVGIPKQGQEVHWVFNDDNKKTLSVSKARSLVSYGNIVYLVQSKKFFDLIGNPEITNTSDITLVRNPRTSTSPAGSGRFFKTFNKSRYEHSQWSGSFQNADTVGLDVEEEFYYLVVKGSYATTNVPVYEFNKMAVLLGLIDADTKIYGVSEGHANTKKFKKYAGIEFGEFIDNKIRKSRKFKTEVKKLTDQETHRRIKRMDGRFFGLLNDKSFMDEMSSDNLFTKVKSTLDNISAMNSDEVELIKSIANYINVTIPKSEYVDHKDLENAYPLVSDLGWSTPIEQITDYIKGMDLLGKLQDDTQDQTEGEAA